MRGRVIVAVFGYVPMLGEMSQVHIIILYSFFKLITGKNYNCVTYWELVLISIIIKPDKKLNYYPLCSHRNNTLQLMLE